jgi:hypothetical protein
MYQIQGELSMRDYIHQLIINLSNLSQPASMSEVAKILLPRHEVFNPNTTVPEDLKYLWETLYSILTKVERWQELNTQHETIFDLDNQITTLTSQRKGNREVRTNLKAEIKQRETELNPRYENFYREYANRQQAINPQRATYNPVDALGKRNFLKDYLEELKKDAALVSLYEKANRQATVLAELGTFGVTISSNTELTPLIESIKQQIDQLCSLRPSFDKMLQQLPFEISSYDIQAFIRQLETQISQEEQDLPKFIQQLDAISLSDSIKEKLRNIYDNAPDPEAFLNDYQSKRSRMSVTGWFYFTKDWLFNPSFSETWSEPQKKVGYLQLLHQHKKQVNLIKSLRDKLPHGSEEHALGSDTLPDRISSEVITDASSSNTELMEQASDNTLCQEAKSLLRAFDNTLSLENATALDLNNYFVDQLPRLHEKIETLERCVTLVEEFCSLDKDIESLRTLHSSEIDPSTSMDTIKIQAEQLLAASKTQPQEELAYLNQQILSCQSMIDLLESMTTCSRSRASLAQENRKLTSEIRAKTEHRRQLGNKDTISFQLSTLQTETLGQIKSLVTLNQRALPTTRLSPPNSKHEFHDPVIKQIEMAESILLGWNKQITPLLPLNLTQWYGELYSTLREKAQTDDENTHHQMDQLLGDIYFELRFPVAAGEFNVLQAYQERCPNPRKDWKNLTDMKPPVPTSNQHLKDLISQDLQERINNLYTQSQHLNATHEREARLLNQATSNLHKMALLAQDSPSHPAIANIRQTITDPRYESLHRHRGHGFLKFCEWLAELCTRIFGGVNAQTVSGYRQSFFFVPTRSTRMMQETAGEIITCQV